MCKLNVYIIYCSKGKKLIPIRLKTLPDQFLLFFDPCEIVPIFHFFGYPNHTYNLHKPFLSYSNLIRTPTGTFISYPNPNGYLVRFD